MNAPKSYFLPRGWMDHPAFADDKPYAPAEAWCWLIENAALGDDTQAVHGLPERVQRGQVAASGVRLGEAWHWRPIDALAFVERIKQAGMLTVAPAPSPGVFLLTIVDFESHMAGCEEGR